MRPTIKSALILSFTLAVSGCATNRALHTQNPCNEANAVSFLFGLLSTGSSKINESCSEDQAIQLLVESNDPGLQAVGVRAMVTKYGEEEAAQRVGSALTTALEPKKCEVLGVQNNEDGTKRIQLGNCTVSQP
jgi:hypothetical protein